MGADIPHSNPTLRYAACLHELFQHFGDRETCAHHLFLPFVFRYYGSRENSV